MDAILFAAAHILRSEGARAFTTERVARLAGVSIGSLYQYFADKHAILTELRQRHGEWLEMEVRAGIERGAAADSLREGVRLSIERMVVLETIDHTVAEASACTAAPLSPDELADFRQRTAAYLRANADRIRVVDPELAAAVITRATEALVHGMSRDEPHWLRHPAFVDEVTELVVGYLAPRSRSRSS